MDNNRHYNIQYLSLKFIIGWIVGISIEFDAVKEELLSRNFIEKLSEVYDYECEELEKYIIISIEEAYHSVRLLKTMN